MRVHIVNLFGLQLCLVNCDFHRAGCALAMRGGLRDVVGVCGRAVSDDLRYGGCAAINRTLQGLHNEDSAALAYNEAVPFGVEWS